MQALLVNQSESRMPRKKMIDWVGMVERALLKHSQVSIGKKQHLRISTELTIVFLGKVAAKNLNQEFRGKAYPTDILSFTSEDPESLGELIICPEVLKKQADENGHSFQRELFYVVLHGILHLLGYEHEDGGKAEKEMMSLQDEVFEKLERKF